MRPKIRVEIPPSPKYVHRDAIFLLIDTRIIVEI